MVSISVSHFLSLLLLSHEVIPLRKFAGQITHPTATAMFLVTIYLILCQLAVMTAAVPLNADVILSSRGNVLSQIQDRIIHVEFTDESTGEPFHEPYPSTIEPAQLHGAIDRFLEIAYPFLHPNWQLGFHNGYNGSLEPPFDVFAKFSGTRLDEHCGRGVWCTETIHVTPGPE
ncbi:hypothetical protein DFH05DRAFT_1456328 [Lentinula detonsa]|uniref:Uncharacterized protein n=1 Tax=Lentinula detonsa TaxID=2804962 RepID=A0A9W8PD84_9AGAR|nr:hypothetical protein DFH05DRAFT_1456328 [Lentinula detonsa]